MLAVRHRVVLVLLLLCGANSASAKSSAPQTLPADHKVVCTLKAGSVIAVGPTQSARCTAPTRSAACLRPQSSWPGELQGSSHHQIFLNLRGRSAQDIGQFLKDCQVSTWPGRD